MAKPRKKKPAPTEQSASGFRNRIKERRRVKAADLIPNPKNWRQHGTDQRNAIAAILNELGQCASLRAIETPQGLMLIDGHLRTDLDPSQEWDVDILDLTPAEADILLAVFDPVAAMAIASESALDVLLASIPDSASIAAVFPEQPDKPTPPPIGDIDLKYSVIIDCENETDQLAILKELDRNSIDCKAICAGFAKTEPAEPTPAPKIEATGKRITRSSPIERTPRVRQLEGIFDVPPAKRSEHEWTVDFQLDRPWSIGLIVGPSGSGKTTLARELFGDKIIAGWPWPEAKSIVDGFPPGLSIHDITGLLSSVGFSSPPSWLKPFRVLSNGEQFRVTLARTLAEAPDLAVVDEFTSVVDRTVAQIGSAALAKTARASGRRFVAVACHYDIEEWLQPDWKYDTASGQFLWRSLRRRPEIQLSIRRVDTSWWKIFGHHHYLSHSLHKAARCFLGEVNGRPACFASVIHNPHKTHGWWREHRTVCLPDFQGIGLGNAISEFIGGIFIATGKEYRSTTSHPAMIRHRCKSPFWEMIRAPDFSCAPSGHESTRDGGSTRTTSSWSRPTAGFRYIGPPNHEMAVNFGIIKADGVHSAS